MRTAASRAGERSIRGLDGVRAIAIVLVVAVHSHVPHVPGGGVGVDIFFVLSGFLITSLLLREHQTSGSLSLPKFWGRRALRLLPALVVLLVFWDLYTVGAHKGGALRQGLDATPEIFFFVSNWQIVRGHLIGVFGPLWSLAVEEQFYLVWPLIVVAVLSRRSMRALGWVAGAVAAAALLDRILTFDPHDAALLRTFGTDYRADQLLVGALLAMALRHGLTTRLRALSGILAPPAVVSLALYILFEPRYGTGGHLGEKEFLYTIGITLIAVCGAAVICYLVTHQDSRVTGVLALAPVAWTGRVSYSMYLWHYPIIAQVAGHVHSATGVFVISLALTFIAAALSWYLVELPLHRRFHERLRSGPRDSLGHGGGPDRRPPAARAAPRAPVAAGAGRHRR